MKQETIDAVIAPNGFNQLVIKYLKDKTFQELYIAKGMAMFIYSQYGNEYTVEIWELNIASVDPLNWQEQGLMIHKTKLENMPFDACLDFIRREGLGETD